MYRAVVKKFSSFITEIRQDFNAQFLTVFIGYFLLSMVTFSLLEVIHYPDQTALNFWHKMVMRSLQQASMIILLFTIAPAVGRKLHLVLMCLVFPSVMLNVGHYLLHDSLLHSGALGATFFASFREMGGYIETFGPDVALALVPFVIAFAVFWRFRFDKIKPGARKLCLVLFIAMLGIQTTSAMVSGAQSENGFFKQTASHMTRRAFESTFLLGNDVSELFRFGREYYKFASSRESMKNASFDAELEDGAPDVAVLVLGESVARSHVPHYGYERNTMPKMMERYEDDDLLVFEDVVALTNLTRLTLMRALTLATHDEREPFYDGESLVVAAKSAGYKTYWISNAGMLTPHDTEHTALARQADKTAMVNTNFRLKSLDEKILPALDDVLEDAPQRKFIVLHTLGSHPKYDQRYSQEYAEFDGEPLPDEIPDDVSDRRERLFNQYDNTILYGDNFLDNVLSRVEEAADNSVFFYFADHGQDMLEPPEKRIGHAHTDPSNYELEVPMFMWASETYKRQNATAWEYLQDARSAPLSTTYLFDTLTDVLRIESDDWAGDRTLVQPDPPEYERIIMSPDEKSVFEYDPDAYVYE